MERSEIDKTLIGEDKFLNALADAYRLQEAIISTTELSIISTDVNGTITSFNHAAEQLLGYDADEVIGKLTPLAFHDADEVVVRSEEIARELKTDVSAGFDTLVAKARIRKSADRREWTLVRKDGTKFPVLISLVALRNDADTLIGYASIATDISEQKIINEKIRESESHLRALVNSIEDIIYEVDEEGRYINAWAKNESSLFLPKNEIIGRTLAEMYGPKFAKPFNDILKKVIETGKTQNLEYKSMVAGDERWFNAKYSLIHDKNDESRKISICIHDITDRKKAEFSVKESEQKFRLLADNIPGVIYLCHNDSNYSMIYLNDKVTDLTGYSKEEFLDGKVNFPQLYHPDDKQGILESVNDTLKKRTSFHITYRIRHRSGEWRWLEEHGIGVYEDDTLLWIEGFINDITQRKQAHEELLRISKENFRVFNNTLSLNAIANFDGYFIKLNPAWEKTLGWSLEQMQAEPFINFVHPDDVERTKDTMSRLSKGTDIISFENRYRCDDGTYRWLLWASSADVKRKIVYASALDITDRKAFEEQLVHSKNNLESITQKLQEQNKQLDEFAHIISHNLRSPVGNIRTLLSFLNENSNIDDFKLIFAKLKNVSKNLSETMNELMDTMQIRKDANIEKIELRFKDILDRVVQSLEGNLIQCGASVTFDFQVSKILFPKTYLESIFQNLLSNAIKYRSPDRPLEVHFSSENTDGCTVLKVRDNGLGIDMERFGDKLFGMHKTFHEHEEARGVGLFLTKTQIDTMGGRIYAESEVNKGTTFIIEFPDRDSLRA